MFLLKLGITPICQGTGEVQARGALDPGGGLAQQGVVEAAVREPAESAAVAARTAQTFFKEIMWGTFQKKVISDEPSWESRCGAGKGQLSQLVDQSRVTR